MLVGRLPLQTGSTAGCWMGVAKSMCSVMLKHGEAHISHGNLNGWGGGVSDQLIVTSTGYEDCLEPQMQTGRPRKLLIFHHKVRGLQCLATATC